MKNEIPKEGKILQMKYSKKFKEQAIKLSAEDSVQDKSNDFKACL